MSTRCTECKRLVSKDHLVHFPGHTLSVFSNAKKTENTPPRQISNAALPLPEQEKKQKALSADKAPKEAKETPIESDAVPSDVARKKSYKTAVEAYRNVGALVGLFDYGDGQIINTFAPSL